MTISRKQPVIKKHKKVITRKTKKIKTKHLHQTRQKCQSSPPPIQYTNTSESKSTLSKLDNKIIERHS